ncbi:alcohol dehydrogenase catalytic domain-containing protein [Thermoanaerobacterium thermosaccharolyticum]|uniref:zinc-dependent alcohol dehydrogenase n=1 Tax=Thermoanaerobacterium thermosaccharolyticum TaxID=1517 RepID=UPI003DA9AF35
MEKMKVVVIEDIKKTVVREMNIPKLNPNQVLVKIHQCNICTTDWQTWAGLRKSQGRQLPWVPGHEISGEIVEIGSNVSSKLKIGMKVGIGSHGSRGCGECVYCRRGFFSKCLNKPGEFVHEGFKGYFGMAQYGVFDSNRIYILDENLPYEEGAYLEPVSTSVHGIKRLRVCPGENVLVIGAGNLGLVNAQVAKVFGGNVAVSEIDEKRCQISKDLGFITINPLKDDLLKSVNEITDKRGMDAVILATGSSDALQQGFKSLATMGRLLLFAGGYPSPVINIETNLIHYKEYELIGTYNADPSDFQIAAFLLNNKMVNVKNLISYKIPIDDAQTAFELASTPGNYRVSISMW